MSALDGTPPAGLFSQLGLVIVRHKDAQAHQWPCHTLPESLYGMMCHIAMFDGGSMISNEVVAIEDWPAVAGILAPLLWRRVTEAPSTASWYSPHSKSVLRRLLHIAAVRYPHNAALASTAALPFRDPVQDLNEPAVMSLVDRHSWTSERLCTTMFDSAPTELSVHSLVGMWGSVCYNLSKTPLPV